jgi:hypothetical protein
LQPPIRIERFPFGKIDSQQLTAADRTFLFHKINPTRTSSTALLSDVR